MSDVGLFVLSVTLLVYASLMLAALITAARRGQWGWVIAFFVFAPIAQIVWYVRTRRTERTQG